MPAAKKDKLPKAIGRWLEKQMKKASAQVDTKENEDTGAQVENGVEQMVTGTIVPDERKEGFMKKAMKKIAAGILITAMILIMAVPAMAATGTGYYTVGSAVSYSDPITVKVVVLSRCNDTGTTTLGSSYINKIQTVTLGEEGTSGQTFTVRDAMIAFNAAQSTATAYNSDGTAISNSDRYIYGFSSGSYTYEPLFRSNHGDGNILCDGWMFRINGKIPISSTMTDPSSGGLYGTDISQTPIADGDVIFFYWDYPWKESGTLMSTNFVAADASYSNGTVSVKLVSSYDWFADKSQGYNWTISSFTTFKPANNMSAIIYDTNGTSKGSVVISKTTGTGSKAISLPAGTYYISVPGVRATKTLTGVGESGNSVSCKCLQSTYVYDKFVVE